VLVIDEVWETGETMAEVVRRVREAGGIVTTAVIHYKPGGRAWPWRPTTTRRSRTAG